MTRILTVDDSRAIRSIVTKAVIEMGFEVEEAENGQEGLSRLEECQYDLVILDVTMPVMDGPQMLQKMRETGNQTPVLMLTSESKRSTIATVMKAGIDDYILKPFRPEELAAKVRKSLRLADGVVAADPNLAAAAAKMEPSRDGTRQFIDVLVIDDMENVQKKLRSMLPQHLTVQGAVSAQAALSTCRDRVARVVLVDSDIPDVNSIALMNQLRVLQPHAVFLSLTLRSGADPEKEAKGQGFDGVMLKPFDKNAIEDFLLKYFDNQDLVTTDDNLVRVGAFSGSEDRLERYFQRLGTLIPPALQKMASACFENAIVDISAMPPRPDLMPRLVASLDDQSKKMGIELRLVGNKDGQAILQNFTETGRIPFFPSIQEARS